MAVMFISEFERVIETATGRVPVVVCPPHARQTVAIGGASVPSAAFNARTKVIRVHVDAICSIACGGTAPTATTVTDRMAAGQTEYFGVVAGDKIAVISNT